MSVYIKINKLNSFFRIEFRLIEGNDLLFYGNYYKFKSEVIRALKSIRLKLREPDKYIKSKRNYSVRAGNNRTIGRSPDMDPEKMEWAMELLQKHGANAEVVWEKE